MTQEVQAETRVEPLENGGVIVRGKNGRFLPGTRSPAPITDANAREFQQRRVEMARERVIKGANAAVAKAQPNDWDNPQDLDYVEAIAEAQATQALMVGDPTSTRAAEWTMAHSGLPAAKQAEPQVVRHEYVFDAQTAEVLQLIASRQQELSLIAVNESIDVEVTQGEEGAE